MARECSNIFLYFICIVHDLDSELVIMSVMGHDVYKCRLIKYNKAEYARIGIMPRYGNADSIKWFQVDSTCTFHLLNCLEDGTDEVD